MDKNISTEKIDSLFRRVMRIHKYLLDFQRLVSESMNQKRYSPYEVLQMAINHPDYGWLRKISGVMALMDEATSDKKNPASEKQLKDFAKTLTELFSETTADVEFKKRFDIAVARDPKLASEVSELKAALAAVTLNT